MFCTTWQETQAGQTKEAWLLSCKIDPFRACCTNWKDPERSPNSSLSSLSFVESRRTSSPLFCNTPPEWEVVWQEDIFGLTFSEEAPKTNHLIQSCTPFKTTKTTLKTRLAKRRQLIVDTWADQPTPNTKQDRSSASECQWKTVEGWAKKNGRKGHQGLH